LLRAQTKDRYMSVENAAGRTERPTGMRDTSAWRRSVDRFVLERCRRLLVGIKSGCLVLEMPSGLTETFGAQNAGRVRLKLNTYAVFWKSIRRGSIGFGEAYMAGDFETDDLVGLLRFFLDNKSALMSAGKGYFRPRLPDRIAHRRRANSKAGSRKNIAAHYDLGNAFYARWLDPSMTYSSALFSDKRMTLEQAQAAKYACVLAALEAQPGQRLLEIGCGWGGFAEVAVRAGLHVTGITLSREQLEYANRRLAAANLENQSSLRFQDYRDTTGSFDRIASIEMIEAVGEEHWPAYFRTLADRLTPGGIAVIQAITIEPKIFEVYRKKPDFIQRYVFPGGMLLTEKAMVDAALAVGLSFERVETFRHSYAQTLATWHKQFLAAWPEIGALGFDLRFKRMWIYYLAYCEAGFSAGTIDVGIYRFRKSPLGPTNVLTSQNDSR
jgi:cyclopropane-fatty-acyl-phospholipid synthase